MKANELMVGDWVRVNRDGICIKKDTAVQVTGIDGQSKLKEKGRRNNETTAILEINDVVE